MTIFVNNLQRCNAKQQTRQPLMTPTRRRNDRDRFSKKILINGLAADFSTPGEWEQFFKYKI